MSEARPPTLAVIRRGLAESEADVLEPPADVRERASVALVFTGAPTELELCFIRRAVREDDRWSGHIAFPGGRASEADPGPEAVARRETAEEVGLDLASAEFLGRLDEQSLSPSGSRGVLSPFAYYAGPKPAALVLEAAEVAAADWLGLSYLWSAAAKTTMPWEHQGTLMRFPGLAHGDGVIWGLTHRILTRFATRIGHPLP